VAKAADEPREEAAAVSQRAELDGAPVLICYDGSKGTV
jgi:hypothetical protein